MKKTLVSLAAVMALAMISPGEIDNPATKDLPKVQSEFSHFRQSTHNQLKFVS